MLRSNPSEWRAAFYEPGVAPQTGLLSLDRSEVRWEAAAPCGGPRRWVPPGLHDAATQVLVVGAERAHARDRADPLGTNHLQDVAGIAPCGDRMVGTIQSAG